MKTAVIGCVVLGLLATTMATAGDDLKQRALALSKTYPLVDGHIDVPYRSYRQWADIAGSQPGRDFDYPRAKSGGLDAPFMSIYVPASAEADGSARQLADILIDQVEAMVQRHPDRFALAYSPAQIRQNFDKGLMSLPLGMENGAPIAGDLDNLKHFYNRGIRYITLAHSKSNHISDSSYDPDNRQWQGLSPFGETLVDAMNDWGIMVDVSHISDAAFFDVMRRTRAPVIASHSSARFFTPDFERNMSDPMIEALAENQGVIMINFGSGFVTAEAVAYGERAKTEFAAKAKASKLQWGSPQWRAAQQAYREKAPYPFATVAQVADHIDHVRDRVGVEHIGIGSDYDGVGDTLPVGLKDVASYPNLIAELLARGYGDEDIAAIMGGNVLRVWTEVEKVAAATSSTPSVTTSARTSTAAEDG